MKTVFIDMDGVLSDFAGSVMREFGLSHCDCRGRGDIKEICGIDKSKLISICDPTSFWVELGILEDAKEIVNLVKKYTSRVALLSDPGVFLGAPYGKHIWLQRHFPDLVDLLILTPSKKLVAHKDAILIEDYDHNIEQFRAAGGAAIMVPRPWNSEWEMADKSFEIFSERFVAAMGV